MVIDLKQPYLDWSQVRETVKTINGFCNAGRNLYERWK